jgi:hypothetical protein
MNNKEIRNIFIEAAKDATLNNAIDVDAILEAMNRTDTCDLGKKSLADLCKEIYEALLQVEIDNNERSELCKKLVEYRLVDEIYKLHKGKHVRWIREQSDKPYLTNGGIVVDIKFLDNGVHVVCKNKNRFIQYKFDDCITFQKLSTDEQLILGCFEFVNNK